MHPDVGLGPAHHYPPGRGVRRATYRDGARNGHAFHFLSDGWRGLRRHYFRNHHDRSLPIASTRFGRFPLDLAPFLYRLAIDSTGAGAWDGVFGGNYA
jgi:hypothetical protein